MNLRERLARTASDPTTTSDVIYENFGFRKNPFPPSTQTNSNPHAPTAANEVIDQRIESFIRDHRSQVVVVEGTQGVGKTNLLNYYEQELTDVLTDIEGFYVVRYLADPEASFDSTLRRLMQEFDSSRLSDLGAALSEDSTVIEQAKGREIRVALQHLATAVAEAGEDGAADTVNAFWEWLQGLRILNRHKDLLGVQFRLDTIESKTLAFRDLVVVSSGAGQLSGIFLLLDELEKQDGTLSPTQVVRYLSAMRAIIDALPDHLFMLLAITPDALRRYSVALPAFRSRLQDTVELHPLSSEEDALRLANFYIDQAKTEARGKKQTGRSDTFATVLSSKEIGALFEEQYKKASQRGDDGVRQREFLHALHLRAEQRIQQHVADNVQPAATKRLPTRKGVTRKRAG
ncbi:BREX system ATP-binding domain-containing protein [Burkholderia gladioli]|uniref:BREX system ATP-binding domain-containing protein n=1 Tax=Burkholderia gladioli TaxID=28095 RepID=UPI001641AD48|nr:BREX system ATP-binding domain-containing protein [Burkholderia gladioli]